MGLAVPMPVFVFLHHLDDLPELGQRFVELGKERVQHPLVLQLEYYFPEAPRIPINTGQLVRLWCTVSFNTDNGVTNVVAEPVLVVERAVWIRELIAGYEAQGTPASEIVLCGFRQGGGMLAAAVPFMEDVQLGGVVLMSSFLPAVETIQGWIDARGGPETLGNRGMPILAIHRRDDTHIDAGMRRRADGFFQLCGYYNHRSVEASFLNRPHGEITDGMWMLVWQFVIQVLDKLQ